MKIHENHSLKALNSFGLDVQARFFCELRRLGGLKSVLQWRRQHPDLPVLLLGGGSNLLLTRDYPGLVLRVRLLEREVLGSDAGFVYVRAGAGENWHDFVRWTLEQGLAGLENLSLIPGTVGAAPIQNIGAYGIELKDVFYELQALDWRTAELREFSLADCRFGYRDSFFKSVEPGRWLIASVTFRLPLQPQWKTAYAGIQEQLQGAEPSALRISDAVIALRRSKLPDPAVLGNAGSFFKNPLVSPSQWQALRADHPALPGWPQPDGQVKLSAAWLIEQCGWKGRSEGDAGVHAGHALVLVNHAAATGTELWQLACRIMVSVQARFGVALEPEPLVLPRPPCPSPGV
ncbi:MAG TPA: UDP-N-acetylmuramate dehydrogenase [Thiolinea sp.]|nr:UDP-N-acetylmuramate dehydrogenase [Thiolinea sp.]